MSGVPFAPADRTTIFLALTVRGVCLAVINSGFGTGRKVSYQPQDAKHSNESPSGHLQNLGLL